MAKLTLTDVTTGYSSATRINANNDLIEAALENTLSRDGTSPNGMAANLDMNSHRIINLAEPVNPNDAARLTDIGDALNAVADAEAAQAAAEVAQAAAEAAASSAASAQSGALAALDSFDDRYLGAKAVAPTLDNDGNALATGALYFDTALTAMYVWTGTVWEQCYATIEPTAGNLLATNNLSDLSNASTSRTNLGVTATGADTTYAYRANNLSDLASAATARTNLGLATIASSASAADLTTGSLNNSRVQQSNVTQHQAALSIAETQIPDGSVLARVGENETVTGSWAFTARPVTTSAGGFLSYASATQSGGSITVSTSDPSGTPGAGDLWIKYTP